jgi:hypothetical protein
LLGSWHRIERVVRWAGLSVNSFALSIGLSRAENLYQIKRGHNGISRDLAAMIAAKYHQISRAWLLTGEGDMFTSEIAPQRQVPFYGVDIEKYIASPQRFTSSAYVSLPDAGDAEFGAIYRGRAMSGGIPDGATVLVKKVDPGSVVDGGDYLVVAEGLALLRRVRREAAGRVLRLAGVAEGCCEEIRIEAASVRELYRVCTVIINKAI